MKKIIASLAAVAAIAFAGAACANPLTAVETAVKGDYVQVQGGSQFSDSYGGGASWSVAGGRDFGLVRAEVEYLGANIGNYGTAQTVNVNAYVQPITIANFTPFIGGGIGYGRIVGHDATVLNAQVGTSYPLTTKLKAVVAYRYTTDQFGNATGASTSAVTAGLRYTF